MDCIFCKIINGEIPSYKVYEDNDFLAFLDINPTSTGHTLLIPKIHTKDLESIDEETLSKIILKAKELSKIITNKLNANGYSICQNNGICQEVKHFHIHIIPKYTKKTNLTIEEAYKKITE